MHTRFRLSANSPLGRWLCSLATISGNALVQALSLVIFARTLGSAEYGVIVAATAIAMVAAEFVGFGAGDLLIREVSRNRNTHRAAFGRALKLVGYSLVPIAIIATWIADVWFPAGASMAAMFVLVTSEIVAIRLVYLSEQIAIAHHATHAANASRIFATVVRFVAVCLAVFVAGVQNASEWALYAAVGSAAAGFGCLYYSARQFGSPDFDTSHHKDLHIGALFSAMQVIRAAQYSVDKFAVGLIAGPAVLGTFGAASRVSQLAILPTSAITRITYPMFFAHGAKGIHAAIAFGRRIAPPVIAVGLASSLCLIGVAYILPYLLGPSFESATPFLILLAPLPVAAALQNISGSILSGADFQWQRVMGMVAGFVSTVGCIGVGMNIAGITGAIVGYVAGQFLAAATTWVPVVRLRRQSAFPSEVA